ncbi:uncharacterized protein K460DRAFT_182647 [Cucurbitaria berberidis CBS 394.84]|uniref:Uncharacterized protein n=1 Tax=Cucurbitaria berberidis CBS 394.84 TaxID=1168544 RepID=A0A9P4GB42_9PLEO|nr:uncharacterized protein K460DRAFT_182647 [Cucurbitaria berberidis CBS 394.84]KAF1842340.1 hypothetical protein K460DRAFT_182647 [Cucurbitaria berberidis CBS 394.84]
MLLDPDPRILTLVETMMLLNAGARAHYARSWSQPSVFEGTTSAKSIPIMFECRDKSTGPLLTRTYQNAEASGSKTRVPEKIDRRHFSPRSVTLAPSSLPLYAFPLPRLWTFLSVSHHQPGKLWVKPRGLACSGFDINVACVGTLTRLPAHLPVNDAGLASSLIDGVSKPMCINQEDGAYSYRLRIFPAW